MDRITPQQRSANMRSIKSKGMKPELKVRKLLHSMGYRFRLHRRDLPGNPDIVFSRRKKVIFVHGCFWHQHTGCALAHAPRSNTHYWSQKLARNVQRDELSQRQLSETGWEPLTIWECELKDAVGLKCRLTDFLKHPVHGCEL